MLTKKDLIYIGLIAIMFNQVFCKNSIENMSNVNNQVVKNEIINQIKSELSGTYKNDIENMQAIADAAKNINSYLPSKVIVAFHGTVNDIPNQWVLCNGQNGTPDLRGRFIYGHDDRSGKKKWKNTGGAENHTLTKNQIPSHTHNMHDAGNHLHGGDDYKVHSWRCTGGDGSCGGSWVVGSGWGTGNTHHAGTHKHTLDPIGSGHAHNNMPPYYVLAYIMKK